MQFVNILLLKLQHEVIVSFLERAIVTHLSEDDCEKSGHNESQESKTAEKVDKPLPGQRSVENVCKASNQSVSLKPFVLSGKAY